VTLGRAQPSALRLESSLAAWRAALGANFGGGCSAFVAAADGVMLRLRRHVTADGLHLFEQIDKQNPKPTPATDNPPAEVPETEAIQPNGIQQTFDAPKPFEPPVAEKKAPLPEEPLPNNPPEEETPPEEIPEEEERYVTMVEEPFFWRWLLLLILLLLLLFGFLWHFWKTHGVQTEAALKAEVAALWEAVDKKAKECGLPPFQRPVPPSAPAPQEQTVPPSKEVTPQELEKRREEKNVNPNAKLNVSLTWNDKSDLDILINKEPKIRPTVPGKKYLICDPIDCGVTDVDANFCETGSECNLTDRPLENMTWPDQVSPGHYKFFVKLHSINKPKSEVAPIPFTVHVTRDGKSQSFKGVIEPQEITCEERCSAPDKFVTEFTIDASAK
jgi:hypothetical protein